VSHLEVLESELRKFEIDLPSPEKVALAMYCDELHRWNKKINLTGLTGADMVRRLVVEPVWIGLQLKPTGVLADIGSGNGSPAIPLHVVCGLQESHLIEVRTKRAAFLRHVATTLKLSGLQIHKARFEEVAKSFGQIDWITLQGVALEAELIDSIKQASSATTTVAWITSLSVQASLKPEETFRVPFTDTQVLLFHVA
jgi:16S rRNA (guanine(527)-N(7))-methyltransferase RsmG